MSWLAGVLTDLGTVERGRSRHRPRNDPALFGGPYPFFQTGDVKAAELWLADYSDTYSEQGLAQSRLWPRGTLCITIAANIAETAILAQPGCFPDSVVGFSPHQDCSDVVFVKYLLDYIRHRFQAISRGTTQDNLSLDKLLSVTFKYPPHATQRKIAAVLSAYDDHIENGSRRIKLLEEIARRIYREWFIDFRYPGHEGVLLMESELGPIPTGWKVLRLGDVVDVNAHTARTLDSFKTIEYIDIASVDAGFVRERKLLLALEAPGRARRLVSDGDIIWSTVRPNRRAYALIVDPAPTLVVSTGFAVLSTTELPPSFLYSVSTSDSFVDYLVNHATGAAYPAVTGRTFADMKIVVPSQNLLERYALVTDPALRLAAKMRCTIENLRVTRDLLLPRLISGDIDVADLNIEVSEAA